jgi:hypothetical protein
MQHTIMHAFSLIVDDDRRYVAEKLVDLGRKNHRDHTRETITA